MSPDSGPAGGEASPIADMLLLDIGAPFAIGMAVGYFAKKAVKIALFIAGLGTALLFLAEYSDLIELNDEALKHVAHAATDTIRESGDYLVTRLSNITSKGLSATAGFFAGLKMA